MSQEVVAEHVRELLGADGVWAHVFATTHRGIDADDDLPHPRPPWDRIDELATRYLGPVRRAGQGVLPVGTRSGEEDVMKRAGFIGPKVLEVKRGEVIDRRLDEVVSAVYSLSSSAPHLFGERIESFEDDLRQLLRSSSPTEWFAERTGDVAVLLWHLR